MKTLCGGLVVASVLALTGCDRSCPCPATGGSGTTSTVTERSEYQGVLLVLGDNTVSLKNPKNGHEKSFKHDSKTKVVVDGKPAPTPLPNNLAGMHCRVIVRPGTDHAVLVELNTK